MNATRFATLALALILAVVGRIALRSRFVRLAPKAVAAGGGLRTADRVLLHVPRARGGIVVDGDTDDSGWLDAPGPARTGPFLAPNGAPSSPYSDARFVWGDGHLYAALYAADDDIESSVGEPDGPVWMGDAFRLVFAQGEVEYAIDVSPSGAVTDAIRSPGRTFDYVWNSGAHVATERDGTMNDPANADEEWGVEMAIPVESLGMRGERGERIGFAARRCDAEKRRAPICASWKGELVLD